MVIYWLTREKHRRLTERIHDLIASRHSQPGDPPGSEPYTLYIGRPKEPRPIAEGDFVLILHGSKSKSCEWIYKYLHSQDRWKTTRTLRRANESHLRCDLSTKITKVGIIKALDRVSFEAAIRDAEEMGAVDGTLGDGELGPGKGFAVRVLLCCRRRDILSWDDVKRTL